jgi:carbamate kinase
VRIVVAIGGDALGRGSVPMTVEGHRATVAAVCAALAPVAEVHELIISHGRGPQAALLSLPGGPYDAGSAEPFDGLRGQSEGMISYLIEQELGKLLPAEASLATVLTMIEVDPDDAAFAAPTAAVGPVYTAGSAHRIAEQRGWSFRREGTSWRRVVPSPEPRRVLEIRAIEWLLASGCVVICAGGGGIPTMSPPGAHSRVAVEAVIDEERASAVLAQELGADLLILVGAVNAVYVDQGTPDQRAIVRAHPDALDMERLAASPMAPKVEAAAYFARVSGRPAVIGSVDHLPALLAGEGGTRITTQAEGVETR